MLQDGVSLHSGLLDEDHLGVNASFALGVGESSVGDPLLALGVFHNVVTHVSLGNGVDSL